MQAHDARRLGALRQPEHGHFVEDLLALVHGAAPLADELGGVLDVGDAVRALADRREFAPGTQRTQPRSKCEKIEKRGEISSPRGLVGTRLVRLVVQVSS